MNDKRRNQQRPIDLEPHLEVLATAYGSGDDDYLAIVLVHDHHAGEFIVWNANWSYPGDDVPVGEGDYFNYRRTGKNRHDTYASAWSKFVERSARLRAYAAEQDRS